MADRYWRGGSGTWDATTTTNWSATSGGAGGASAPTSADNVIFNSASNATAYTVTVGADAACADITVAGPASGNVTFSLGATSVINCYGSFTLPATGLTWTPTTGNVINFLATTTGKTVTTNGVSVGNTAIVFNGAGGGWTLGSAYTATSGISVTQGTFNTGNFNVTVSGFTSTGTATRSFVLGSSTITLSAVTPINITQISGITFNAGTSTINCSGASPGINSPGLTFYNVGCTSTALGAATITGANTFNNLSFTARATSGIGQAIFDSASTTTVNGTLTLGSGTTGVSRLFVRSSTAGSPATLSVATLAAMTDIDFRDITAAGTSSPWSGTRIGDCLGNSNITFTSARTVYWNLTTSGNWNSAAWSTTSGNTGGTTTAFPLAQDSIVFDNAGLTSGNTITYNAAYQIGSLSFASRSNALTFNTGAQLPNFYGDYTLSSSITVTGNGLFNFFKQGGTATITSAGITFPQPIQIICPNGTVRINGNLTLGSTLTTTLNSGTLDLTNGGAGNYTLSTGIFSSTNANTRVIAFGTGNITLTGTNITVWTTATATNFSYTGTPTVNVSGAGTSGQTRTIGPGTASSITEATALNFNITTGTDTITITTNHALKNLNFTGFAGSVPSGNKVIYGNLTLSSGMTLTAGTGLLQFSATSGTQLITTNGTTIDLPVTQNGVGGTVQLQDNLTIGSTRLYTLTAGTLDLNNKIFTTGSFASSNVNTRAVLFGTGRIDINGRNFVVLNLNLGTFTYTGTPTVNLTGAGTSGETRSVSMGNSLIESNVIDLYVKAGSDIISSTGVGLWVGTLDFTGFTGTFTRTLTNQVYRNLVLSSGMTYTATNTAINFAGTAALQQSITNNGVNPSCPLGFIGTTVYQLQDSFSIDTASAVTLTSGTLYVNSKTLTAGIFSSANTNARTLDLGTNGKITVTGSGSAWNASTATNFTLSGTGTISMDSGNAKTFFGGGAVYPYTLNQGGLGTLTLNGANTFNDITNTVQPCTITFPASTTTSVKNFNVRGTAGNLVSLRSSTSGTRYTLAYVA